MLATFNFKSSEASRVYLVSDMHFHHDKQFLYTKRGYKSIEEHDSALIKIWNERVRPEDIVINLGDFIFRANKELAEEYINRLNGTIYYLWGNHNSGMKQIYKSVTLPWVEYLGLRGSDATEIYPAYYYFKQKDKLIFVGDYMKGWINSTPFIASHFAHRVWDCMQKGAVHFCGHSHASDIESNPNFPNHKRLDVGIENFGGPISFEDAMNIMNKKLLIQVDHHDARTQSGF